MFFVLLRDIGNFWPFREANTRIRGTQGNTDHLVSNCRSGVSLGSQESKLSGCELFFVLNAPACSVGSNSLQFRRNGCGPYCPHFLSHLEHLWNMDHLIFLEYGPVHIPKKYYPHIGCTANMPSIKNSLVSAICYSKINALFQRKAIPELASGQ